MRDSEASAGRAGADSGLAKQCSVLPLTFGLLRVAPLDRSAARLGPVDLGRIHGDRVRLPRIALKADSQDLNASVRQVHLSEAVRLDPVEALTVERQRRWAVWRRGDLDWNTAV